MIVNANMSREVYDYFREYDLSQVVDALLEMYDFTNLPQRTGPREKECKINVSNEYYISLYKTLGARSKKLSLGRLLEFAYNMDVLALPRFQQMRKIEQHDDPTPALIHKAYIALLTAQTYDGSEELKDITKLVYEYDKYVRKDTNNEVDE